MIRWATAADIGMNTTASFGTCSGDIIGSPAR